MGHAHTIRENPGQIAGVAALGAAAGAITALLFTPRTGEQLRSGIGRRAKHGKETITDKMHNAKNETVDKIDGTKEKAKGRTSKK